MTTGAMVLRPEDLLFTPFVRRRQVESLEEPGGVLCSRLENLWEKEDFKGQRIAITVGSRGIASRVELVKAVVDVLKSKGASPFALNAMGSHGGATKEGQLQMLESLGYQEETLGCPVESSMDYEEIEGSGGPVVDRFALEADGVVVLNRIKPHTSFRGQHESGLVKMLVVGLGKAEGARRIHRLGPGGLRDVMPVWAKKILGKIRVVGAVGIVENALDQVMAVEVSQGRGLLSLDAKLLELARPQLPGLPVSELDVLLIDEMGKDISGTGMDTNVIGRLYIHGQNEPEFPKIGRIVVHDLTPASNGNGTGVGLADVVGPRFLEKFNREVTQRNVLTTGFIQRAKLPFSSTTDLEGLGIALSSLHGVEDPSILRIKNTLHPDEFWASGPIINDLKTLSDVEQAGDPRSIYDSTGQLKPFTLAG